MATERISLVEEKSFEKKRDFHLHELKRLAVKLTNSESVRILYQTQW